MWKPILAISLGAALGALLRWQLGLKLNSLLPSLPPGTLTAKLIGGYIIGLAVAYFAQAPDIRGRAGHLAVAETFLRRYR